MHLYEKGYLIKGQQKYKIANALQEKENAVSASLSTSYFILYSLLFSFPHDCASLYLLASQ